MPPGSGHVVWKNEGRKQAQVFCLVCLYDPSMVSHLADHYTPLLDIFNKVYETKAQIVRSQWMPPG